MAVAAIAGSACGASAPGDDDVPNGVIARVGERTLAGAELERFMAEVRASYGAHDRSFPEPGSADYRNLTGQAIEVLVGRMQDELSAEELGVVVTDDEVEAALDHYRRAQGADEFDRTLSEAGVTLERVRANKHAQLLENAIFVGVVSEVELTDDDLRAYYDAHRLDYTRWPPRLVDSFFVRDKALARKLYERIRAGDDFLALAREYGSREVPAGRSTIADIGSARLPFQHDAFTLAPGEVSLTYSGVGWTILRPVSALKAGRLIPFADVADALRRELREKGRKEAMDAWTKENETKLAALTSYRAGWNPAGLRREPRFPLPGLNQPLCPEPLIEDPYDSSLEEAEIESGYANYLMNKAGECVDPDAVDQ
jgi:hypothetical protein